MNEHQEPGILISFYGDDFTGSTDVMESLALNGIPTALFLEAPSHEEILNFRLKQGLSGDRLMAFGVAGIARSLSPIEMEAELIPIFKQMSQVPSDFFHYKVCSTLDSSPEVGNIGRAVELAERFFPSANIPFIAGAPFLNRFVVFGNLFARIGTETYRLDRHPVMAHHPVTPMRESDIGLHLAQQSERPFRNFDLHALNQEKTVRTESYRQLCADNSGFIIFDTLRDDQLPWVGELISQHREGPTQLLVGSSGVSLALARYLQQTGSVHQPDSIPHPGKASALIAVAGSCSPVTDRQIAYAIEAGFESIPLDVLQLLDSATRHAEIQRVLSYARNVLAANRNPMIFSARGPKDPSIAEMKAKTENSTDSTGKMIGMALGELTRSLLESSGPSRVVVAGGDTSGYVARSLEIYALETLCPIAPGAPLCLAHSHRPEFDQLEISLKGGQCGTETYFEAILNGNP